MQTKEIKYSLRIGRINFILTFFIILLHSRIPYINSTTICNVPQWYSVIEKILVNVYQSAVPTFFAISAYLLFRNYTFKDYFKKISSRIHSLVIPYLIFSSTFLVLKNALYFLKHGYFRSTANSLLMDIYSTKFDLPIWYCRALFYFVVLSPILLFILKHFKKRYVFIIFLFALIIPAYLSIPYDTFFYWLPPIICFSYLGYNHPNLLFRIWYIKKRYSIIALILYILLCFLMIDVNERSYPYWLFRMVSPLFIFIIFELLQFEDSRLFKYSFFYIYGS